jgi:disulfide bond formation protein DsbB
VCLHSKIQGFSNSNWKQCDWRGLQIVKNQILFVNSCSPSVAIYLKNFTSKNHTWQIVIIWDCVRHIPTSVHLFWYLEYVKGKVGSTTISKVVYFESGQLSVFKKGSWNLISHNDCSGNHAAWRFLPLHMEMVALLWSYCDSSATHCQGRSQV